MKQAVKQWHAYHSLIDHIKYTMQIQCLGFPSTCTCKTVAFTYRHAHLHTLIHSYRSNAYPVFVVPGSVLQQVLQLDGAVGHKVIIPDGCIVEH